MARRHLLRGSRLVSRTVPGGRHHSVVAVRDLEVSLRSYRDGIGLDLLRDRQVEGDWPDLLDAPLVHDLGAGGDDGSQFAAVDDLGGAGGGVAGEPGDLLDADPAVA